METLRDSPEMPPWSASGKLDWTRLTGLEAGTRRFPVAAVDKVDQRKEIIGVRPFPGLLTVCAHSSDDADGGARGCK